MGHLSGLNITTNTKIEGQLLSMEATTDIGVGANFQASEKRGGVLHRKALHLVRVLETSLPKSK